MIKSIFVAALATLSLQATAATPADTLLNTLNQQLVQPVAVEPNALLPWIVGESLDFNMNAGFIQGTVHMFVREETAEGFWLQQDMDLGMFGKQKVEVLYNKDTGEVIKMLVNGEEQTPPSAADQEIVETKNDNITVPAGTFECMYVKIHDKKENKDSEAWITRVVPISGMLKSIAQSQFGPVTIELTAYNNL